MFVCVCFLLGLACSDGLLPKGQASGALMRGDSPLTGDQIDLDNRVPLDSCVFKRYFLNIVIYNVAMVPAPADLSRRLT